MIKTLLLLLTVSLPMATSAWAFTLTLDAGTNFSGPVDGGGGSNSHPAQLGLAGGAELGLMLGGGWGIDLGGLFVQRRYDADASAQASTVTQEGIEVPLMARYWVGNVVSFGLGGYYFRYTGDITSSSTLGGVTSKLSRSYDLARQTPTDYGAVASIRFDFPLGLMSGFVLDGRYELGLKNNSLPGDLKFRDFTAIVGLRLGWTK